MTNPILYFSTNVQEKGLFGRLSAMNKNRPFLLRPRSLAFWLVAGVGAFVLVGSVAMMGFFQRLSRVEEAVALESIGRTNALFLDQSNLPQSAHMAEQLGRVMGAEKPDRITVAFTVEGCRCGSHFTLQVASLNCPNMCSSAICKQIQ